MIKKFVCLLTAVTAASAVTLSAQQSAAVLPAGTLKLDKKTYTLKHALAYETTIDDEPAIAVVLSGTPVPSETLTEARASEKEGGDGDFKKPFLKLVFGKTGELKYWSAAAEGTSMGRQSGEATGELKLQAGRVSGKATQPLDTDSMFPAEFQMGFDTALLKAGESLPPSTPVQRGPAAKVKPTVAGVFKGNGKEANLAYVSARWVEPFDGKPGMMLVFTEKDHAKDPKPDFGAAFGKFGSALIISLFEDGGIYGCQVAHTAHEKRGFTSLGTIHMNDFAYADGQVTGELTTDGELDTFGEKWEVKLKFVAPLGDIPKEFQPEAKKEPKKEAAEADDEPANAGGSGADEPAAQLAAAALKAKDLALTNDATNVEYQAMMKHVVFQSKADVKSVCAELATKLKAQGWTSDGADMVQPTSSIPRRSRGEASLTIFVKPGPAGSNVQIFTEGLSWEGQ